MFKKQILQLFVIFTMCAYSGTSSNNVYVKSYSYSLATPHDSLVVVAPNVFTPNGDGVNDHWSIIIHDYGIAIMDLEATVYDRWGKEIFKTTNIHQVWNGNNHIGKACEEGTYFFVVTYTNGASREKEVHKGFIQLLR